MLKLVQYIIISALPCRTSCRLAVGRRQRWGFGYRAGPPVSNTQQWIGTTSCKSVRTPYRHFKSVWPWQSQHRN